MKHFEEKGLYHTFVNEEHMILKMEERNPCIVVEQYNINNFDG